MQPDDILRALRTQPFRPFRLVLGDGKTYEIRHPELVIVDDLTLVVGVPRLSIMQPVQGYHLVALTHVNRLEPMPVTSPAAN